MFTGIIENLGQIAAITPDGGNVHFDVTSTLAPELKIDQSVAHDGCCLTVVALHGEGVPHGFRVTAIAETLDKTCLGTWSVAAAGARGYGYELVDQLALEHLMGVKA